MDPDDDLRRPLTRAGSRTCPWERQAKNCPPFSPRACQGLPIVPGSRIQDDRQRARQVVRRAARRGVFVRRDQFIAATGAALRRRRPAGTGSGWHEVKSSPSVPTSRWRSAKQPTAVGPRSLGSAIATSSSHLPVVEPVSERLPDSRRPKSLSTGVTNPRLSGTTVVHPLFYGAGTGAGQLPCRSLFDPPFRPPIAQSCAKRPARQPVVGPAGTGIIVATSRRNPMTHTRSISAATRWSSWT